MEYKNGPGLNWFMSQTVDQLELAFEVIEAAKEHAAKVLSAFKGHPPEDWSSRAFETRLIEAVAALLAAEGEE